MVKHLAFIMDGNRRYAKKNSLQIKQGYKKGMEKFLEIISYQIKYNIFETSFFALSKENYEKRPDEEKYTLFDLIKLFSENKDIGKFFKEKKIKIELKGNIEKLKKNEKEIRKPIEELNKWNLENKEYNFKVNLALNYNGQDEIVNSIKTILKKQETGEIKQTTITKKLIKENLWFKSEAPQIIVRTGNAPRLSGFMLWDSNYSEIYFTKKLWPELNEGDFLEILSWYKQINRNFGK